MEGKDNEKYIGIFFKGNKIGHWWNKKRLMLKLRRKIKKMKNKKCKATNISRW